MNNQISDTTPPAEIKLGPDSPSPKLDALRTLPWEQSLSEWQASLPSWLRPLVGLTHSERKQRLDALGWYGPPEGYGIPKLRRKIIQGDWAGLKADHEAQVRAQLHTKAASQVQFVLQPQPPPEPKPLESAFYRRQELPPEFKTIWAEIEAAEAAKAAKEAKEKAAFEVYGFSEHPATLKTKSRLPEGVFTFEQFVRGGYSSYTRLGWFIKSLGNYPFLKDGLITEIGYEILRNAQKSARKSEKLESAKKLREANAPVKQVPEPKKRHRKAKKT
jgi:hypothetical protein